MAKAKKKSKKEQVRFPRQVVAPVGKFLKGQLKQLEARRKSIEGEDPFDIPGRTHDNAAVDTDAEEQFGHARVEAINEQLDRKIIQTRKALARIKIGKYGICSNCGNMIDTDRLMIYPEATLCVKCEKKNEK